MSLPDLENDQKWNISTLKGPKTTPQHSENNPTPIYNVCTNINIAFKVEIFHFWSFPRPYPFLLQFDSTLPGSEDKLHKQKSDP